MLVHWLLSCLTLCNSMDCSLPGASVHGILHARILERVAIPFSKGSSQPRMNHQGEPSPVFQGLHSLGSGKLEIGRAHV